MGQLPVRQRTGRLSRRESFLRVAARSQPHRPFKGVVTSSLLSQLANTSPNRVRSWERTVAASTRKLKWRKKHSLLGAGSNEETRDNALPSSHTERAPGSTRRRREFPRQKKRFDSAWLPVLFSKSRAGCSSLRKRTALYLKKTVALKALALRYLSLAFGERVELAGTHGCKSRRLAKATAVPLRAPKPQHQSERGLLSWGR